MDEYTLYTKILAPRLKVEDSTHMIEDKLSGNKKHIVSIVPTGVDDYSLYRYNQDDETDKFMPFFNNGEANGNISVPRDLLKFCDYILISTRKNKLYVILIELKSGKTTDASKQLKASETFMEFVKSSAIRIKDANGFNMFAENNIKLKKVVVKAAPLLKPATNRSKSQPQVDFNAEIVYLTSNVFPLLQFCK